VPWMAVGRLPRKAAWKAVAERTRGGLVRTSCSRSFPRCPRMLPLCMALVETMARAGAHDCVHMLPIPSGVPPQGPRGDPRPCWPFSLRGRGVDPLLEMLWLNLARRKALKWWERVSSASNLADLPSRGHPPVLPSAWSLTEIQAVVVPVPHGM